MEFGGRKGKEDPQQVPHDARTPTTKREDDQDVYSTSVGSAALPGSEASNYTYTKVQRKTTEGTREKTKGISSTPAGQTRERMKKKKKKKKRERERERERERGNWDWDLGSRVGMHLSCWSCAYDCDSCHVSGRGDQSRPTVCRSCTQPLLRTGPALSGTRH